MGSFARIAVPLPLHRTFHYRIPEHLRGLVEPGRRCVVPFGRTRVAGFVVALDEETEVEKLRDIIDVLDPEPLLPPDLLQLSHWLSSYYHHPPGETLTALLPPGCRATSRPAYVVGEALPQDVRPDGASARLWKRAAQRGGIAVSALRARDAPALGELLRRGLLVREWRVCAPPEPAGETWFERSEGSPPPDSVTARASLQAAALRELAGGPASRRDLVARGVSGDALARLVARGWIRRWVERPSAGDPGLGALESSPPPAALTPEQSAAVAAIEAAVGAGTYQTFLLHGVTGSGKTEVYLRAVEAARRRGFGVVVLVPEISLTPQLLGRFASRFRSEMAVLHSGLGNRERALQWERIRSGRAPIAIGARSAVFAPVPRLGLVVVDEEHEASYKQEEGLRYNAKHAALMRARLAGGVALLGSATPDLESWWGASSGRYRRIVLPRRVLGASPPEIRLVDLRQEERRRRTRVLVSEPLRQCVAAALARGEQALLYLNRRGFSPALSCPACGEAIRCPRCTVALTLHRRGHPADGRLLCHYCDFTRALPTTCPACDEAGLAPTGVGTQRLVEAASEAWPGVRVLRLDRDSARSGGGAGVLGAFQRGDADILVGTQMVAKGHHFPRLTVVGVVDADQSLNFPDFRSAERTFQVLTQVAGRAGRAELLGRVFLQTRNPTHPVLRAVADGNFEEFAAAELEARREVGFPPFRRLALLRLSATIRTEVEQAARSVAEEARRLGRRGGVDVLGPAPAPVEKVRGRYRFQVLLRASGPEPGPVQSVLRVLLPTAPSGGPGDVRVQPDIDPVSLL